MADFWADKYWNGKYFTVKYWGSSDQVEGAISGSAAGVATVSGLLTGVDNSVPAEAPPISGPAYSPNAKAALEMYRILFGKKEKPSKKRRKIKRLEETALNLLSQLGSEEYRRVDLTALNLAIEGLNKRFVPKRDAKPDEKIQVVQELFEEAERLRREIDEDDEDILLMLAA